MGEEIATLKRLIWMDYDKYCMYLKREDLLRIADWLGIAFPTESTRDEMFEQLYSSTGRDRVLAALEREAEERITERENLISNLGGGGQGFRGDIEKLRNFINVLRG